MNYSKIYADIIDRAKNRDLDVYSEVHHIIPKCMGGSNEPHNLVRLTAREHFICHQLLCEIYTEESKLKFALRMMCQVKNHNQINRYKVSSRTYERIRSMKIEVSPATRKKISKALTGKQRSEESKARYSLAQIGNTKALGFKHTEESKKKISESKIGKPRPSHVVETLQELAKTRKGKPLSPEVKAKISAKLKGRVMTEEHKAKIAQSLIGHVHSEDTKRKIAQSKLKK